MKQLLTFCFLICHTQAKPCGATVTQPEDREFVLGKQQHNHASQVGAALAAKITAKTKKEAVNLFKPATAMVDQVPLEELTDAPCPSLPKPKNLARAPHNFLRQDNTVTIQILCIAVLQHLLS